MGRYQSMFDLGGELMKAEELADESRDCGDVKNFRYYTMRAGRLRKSIRRRKEIVARIEKGERRFFGTTREIALAEAEAYSEAGGLKPHEQALWAGVAFAIMMEA